MLVFSINSQTASIVIAIKNRHLVESPRTSNVKSPQNARPCSRCVKLYGSRKVCEVSAPQALPVQRTHDHTNTTRSGPEDVVRRQRPPKQILLSATTKSFSGLMRTLWRGARPNDQPSASRHSTMLRLRQVNMGVSRRVKQLALVSRNSWIKSRNSEGLSVSKATTNSWSSRPNE